MSNSRTDLDELERLAKAATKGALHADEIPFSSEHWAGLNDGSPMHVVRRGQDIIAVVWCGDDRDGEEQANADYIAACSPDRILALVEWVRELETACRGLEQCLDAQRARAEKAEAQVERLREAVRTLLRFEIEPRFDAKGTYTAAKADEWHQLSSGPRSEVAEMEEPTDAN